MSKNITFVNSLENAPAATVPIGDNATLGDFLTAQSLNTATAVVRVGRDRQNPSYVLQDGDTVYVSPLQVKGA